MKNYLVMFLLALSTSAFAQDGDLTLQGEK